MECETNFVSDLELKKHFVTQHSTNYRSLVPVPSSKDVPCILCGKNFTGPEAATKHLQTHHETQCDLCDNVFYEMSALHLHMDTCHASVTFPCNLCHSILNTQPELKLHTQEAHTFNHLGSESSCYICDSTFATESDVLSHIERDHTTVTRNLVLITMVESLDLKLFPYSSESEENDQLNTLLGASKSTLLDIYKLFCRSVLEYAAPV